jgi:uncharacterized membrane protein YqaE (UPF0057 family)
MNEISDRNKGFLFKSILFLIVFPPLSVFFSSRISDIRTNNEIQNLYINRKEKQQKTLFIISLILFFLFYWPGLIFALLILLDRWKTHVANSKKN